MILNFIPCIPNKSLNYFRFTLQTPFRILEQCLQFGQVITRNISQVSNFQVTPNPFDRVEIRSITGQLLQMDAFGRPCGKLSFHHSRTMRRDAIPDDQQQSRDLTLQLAQEMDNFESGD